MDVYRTKMNVQVLST